MNNIVSCLFFWINDKGYYPQSYGKNHKIHEIDILFETCGGQNKNNLMIRSLNMIEEGGFFGTATLHFYIKIHTKNDGDRAFNSLKVLYRKQNIFTFEKCCENLNTSNNVEFIQMPHENFSDLELFLNDICNIPDPKTVNINFILLVKKERTPIGYCQEFCGDAESKQDDKKDNAYSVAQRKITIRKI